MSVQQFTVPPPAADETAAGLVIFHDEPDMTSAPINIWVYRVGGQPRHVRVIGHANEEVCAQVSEKLTMAVANPAVSGFLTFGVADLRPSSDADGFAQVIGPMIADIDALAQTTTYVQMHDVTRDFDDSLPEVRVPAELHQTLGLESSTSADEGPKFIPVRTWKPGQAPAPVVFRVTWKDLGLDTPIGRQLGEDMALAPWIESLERTQGVVRAFDAFIAWRKAGKRLDPDVVSFVRSFPEHSSDLVEARGELEAAIAKVNRVYEAGLSVQTFAKVAAALSLPIKISAGLDKTLKELREALDYDRVCLRMIRKSIACTDEPGATTGRFVTITLRPTEESLRLDLEAIDQTLASVPVDEAVRSRDKFVTSLSKQRVEIAQLQRAGITAIKGGRARMVDGVLRGWAIPTDDDARAAVIDSVIETNVPAIWDRTVKALSPAVFSSEPKHNAMIDPHVFYDVRDVGAGTFEVRPLYIVHGRFLELWNPNAHTVTIQAEEHPAEENAR